MRYRYLAPAPPSDRPRLGSLLLLIAVFALLLAVAMGWASQGPQMPTQGAVGLPGWVEMGTERYPCPEGSERGYSQIAPGVWRADCEG